jgi:hypothetical protein
MKRNFSNLQRDYAESDRDAQRRRNLQRLKDAEFRAERLEQAKKAEIAQLNASLKKWKEENVLSAMNFVIVDPEPIPLGTKDLAPFLFTKVVLLTRPCPALICAP